MNLNIMQFYRLNHPTEYKLLKLVTNHLDQVPVKHSLHICISDVYLYIYVYLFPYICLQTFLFTGWLCLTVVSVLHHSVTPFGWSSPDNSHILQISRFILSPVCPLDACLASSLFSSSRLELNNIAYHIASQQHTNLWTNIAQCTGVHPNYNFKHAQCTLRNINSHGQIERKGEENTGSRP